MKIIEIEDKLDWDQELAILIETDDGCRGIYLTYSDYLKIKAAFEEYKTLDIP